MESEVASYLLAAKSFYTIFAALSAVGILFNSILLFTTIKSKSLRAPCNILIGACSLFDIIHQLGTFTQSSQIYGGSTIESMTCNIIMILPEMGVAAGTFAVLSIGIDRFISIAFPNRYRRMNLSVYLTIQFLAIFLYCAFNAFLIFFFYKEHSVICNMPSVYHNAAVSLWAYSSAALNFIAFIIYIITWRMIKNHSNNFEIDKIGRIFRTIVLVTIFDLSGWATTQTIVATLNFIHFPDHKLICFVCFASIFVNLGIAVKFPVYYLTSTEYRNAVNRQFRDRSKIGINSLNRASSIRSER